MRTEPHSASVERQGDRGEGGGGEEEEMSSTDPDGQPNIPHGIFLFRNPILPNVIDVDWIQWNKANRFSSSDEALMALSPVFFFPQLFPPQLYWLSAISACEAVGGRED